MQGQFNKSFSFVRTTAIGGVLFLLPIVAVAALLASVFQAIVAVHKHLQPWLPFDSATGIALLFGSAIVVLLLACFVAGLLARRAIGARFSGTIEKQLMKVFPKYGIYKDLLAGKIGGEENVPSLRPVLVTKEGLQYLAFQADQLANGLIVVFFPGSPDTWNGSLALVGPEHVQAIEMTFADVLGICERLGRDASLHMNAAIPDMSNHSRPTRG
jgi:uncharacterized membrane protein